MKRVLITGGTSGIGLAAAECFLANGDKVAIAGRSKERGMAAVKSLWSKYPSGEVCFVPGDVSSVSGCKSIMTVMEKWAGGIDVLVNSAGIYFEKAIEDMTEEDFDEMMNVNLKGTYFMSKEASVLMKAQSSGNIVNVASDAGLHGNYMCSAYCASQGAVVNFTRALAIELAPWQIRVNSVCPGDIHTPMTEEQLKQFPSREEGLKEMASVYPLNRIGKPEDVGGIIAFLASDKASFVTGAAWTVDGGITA